MAELSLASGSHDGSGWPDMKLFALNVQVFRVSRFARDEGAALCWKWACRCAIFLLCWNQNCCVGV
jgi:hypothetical protein